VTLADASHAAEMSVCYVVKIRTVGVALVGISLLSKLALRHQNVTAVVQPDNADKRLCDVVTYNHAADLVLSAPIKVDVYFAPKQ